MAKPKIKAADAPTTRARVLVDNLSFGLKIGQIFEAEKSVMDGLVKSGDVDPHPDAVAYAESQGAELVVQPTDAAPEVPAAVPSGEPSEEAPAA
jgi:hypothetical protein